ncbi:MAG TPA: hypothetical protein PLV42_01210 [bacterium]|nr:hypothetical protein [bacterium]
MTKIALLLPIVLTVGCSDFVLKDRGDIGESCFGNGTCKDPFICVAGACVASYDDSDLLLSDTAEPFDDDAVQPDDIVSPDEETILADDHGALSDADGELPDADGDLLDADQSADEIDVVSDGEDGTVDHDEGSLDNIVPDEDADPIPSDEDDVTPPNECVTMSDPCDNGGDIGAVCNDTVAGYDCACSLNYAFNGTFCLADTRSEQPCTGLPANASWNTVSSIVQTWNGSSWQPDTAGVHNQNPSTTECRFICVTDHHWDGAACVSNTRTFTCAEKPENSDWNTVSSYQQAWNGSAWTPSDSATSYSLNGSTTACRYKCAAGSAWTGSACVSSSCGANFPNTFGGLCWSEPTGLPTTWGDAGTHCSSIGGRRPTISELRKLITTCPATQTGGSCGVTDSCLSSTCWSSNCESCTDMGDGRYSVFGDRTWLWSSQELLSYTANAWYVNFKSGRVYNGEKNYTPANYDVRCVQ